MKYRFAITVSVNLCIHFYVIAPADGPRLVDLSRTESKAGDNVVYGSGPGRQQVWDRAIEVLVRASRECALAHHVFRLPHGDHCYRELTGAVTEGAGLPFELHNAVAPDQIRRFRDALDASAATTGLAALVASSPECRRRPETARRFLGLLRTVLAECADDRYLVVRQQDGVWDEGPANEPLDA